MLHPRAERVNTQSDIQPRRTPGNLTGRVLAWGAVMGMVVSGVGYAVIMTFTLLMSNAGRAGSGGWFNIPAGVVIVVVLMGTMVPGAGGGLLAASMLAEKLRSKQLSKTATRLLRYHVPIMVVPCTLLGLIPGGISGLPLFLGASWAVTFVWLAEKMPDLDCTGFCCRCQYNLTGNVSGVCPECGTPVPPTDHC